jgi:hypothetical protein
MAIERCDIQGKCGRFVFYGLAGPTEKHPSSLGGYVDGRVSPVGISGTMDGEFVNCATSSLSTVVWGATPRGFIARALATVAVRSAAALRRESRLCK